MSESNFEKLLKVNITGKIEQRNKFNYLSWAWAWTEFKKLCPDATYKIINFGDKPYLYDSNLGYLVTTEVTANNETHMMWLPVMDGANKSMKTEPYTYKGWSWENGRKTQVTKTVEAATMFDINKALMRCLVKNLAMFGLALHIYAGEDLPEKDDAPSTPPPPPPVKKPEKPKWSKKDVEGLNLFERIKAAVDYLGYSADFVSKHILLTTRKLKFTDCTEEEKLMVVEYLEQKCDSKRLEPTASQVYPAGSRAD